MGYSPQDVREARYALRQANVPQGNIASVPHLLARPRGRVSTGCGGVVRHATTRELAELIRGASARKA